jgi:hypothetical protein
MQMGLTKTKREEEKAERTGGLLAWANKDWRKFIDTLEVANPDTYNDLWMQVGDKTNPKSIDEKYQQWRALVQQAFFEGYQEGFSSRILKGDVNESDK